MFRRQFLATTTSSASSSALIRRSTTTTTSALLSTSTRTHVSNRTRGADDPKFLQADDHIDKSISMEGRLADDASDFRLLNTNNGAAGGANLSSGQLADSATGFSRGIGQMTAEDVLMRIETAINWYHPTPYAWLLLPSIDLIDSLVICGVVPRDQPHLHISRWFAAPEDIVHYPNTLKESLGIERYKTVEPAIMRIFNDYQQISPLLRVLNRYPELPRDIWTALARWMAAMSTNAEMKDVILSLTLAISNGLGPQTLGLPDLQQQRGTIVGYILIGVGAEYGAVSLSQLGVDLLLINGTSCSFQDQKTLTVAFSRTSSRVMDWSVRSSGELIRCLPRWFAHHIAGNKDMKLVELLVKQQQKQHQKNQQQQEGDGSSSKTSSTLVQNNDSRDGDSDDLEKFGDDMEAVEITSSAEMFTSEEAAKKSEQMAMELNDAEEEFTNNTGVFSSSKKKKNKKQQLSSRSSGHDDDDEDEDGSDQQQQVDDDDDDDDEGGMILREDSLKSSPKKKKSSSSPAALSGSDLEKFEDDEMDDLLDDQRSTRLMMSKLKGDKSIGFNNNDDDEHQGLDAGKILSSSSTAASLSMIDDHANDREGIEHGDDEDDEPAASALLGSAPTSSYFATKKSNKEYYDTLHKNLLKQAVERKKLVTTVQESHAKKNKESSVPLGNRSVKRVGGYLNKKSLSKGKKTA